MSTLTILHKIVESARQFPGRNAICTQGKFYTYEEFFQYAAAIQDEILKHQLTSKTIAVYAGNGVYSYASIFAILGLGLAYVPLNKNNPLERNLSLKDDGNFNLVLCDVPHKPVYDMKNSVSDLVIIDTSAVKKVNRSWLRNDVSPETLAYILFTSGSTGKPKGVPIIHANINIFMQHFFDSDTYRFSESDRFLQPFELTFDLSVMSLYLPLCYGACCYVVPDKGISYLNIAKILKEYEITVALMVPSVIVYLERFFDELRFPKLRYNFFCGEALQHNLLVGWSKSLANGNIINIYGPTEATIACAEYWWTEQQSAQEASNGIVPIGKAMSDTELYIVDDSGEQVAKYEKGELCLAGGQVIAAYWRNEEKTKEAFLDLDINGKTKRVYKTGDICQLNENGNMLYFGRTDTQVKIDGYRIELGEIEFHARAITGDTKTIVIALMNVGNDLSLHLVTQKCGITDAEIITYLKKKLPVYMIPKKIHQIEDMPLNINGKVDRKALKERYLDV